MVIVRAPVRISLGGGGTDLAAYYTKFEGFVISAAITRYCYVVVNPQSNSGLSISSADYHIWETYTSSEMLLVEPPLALPKAVLAWFIEQGALTTGVDLFLASEVPPGSGLGSSSAMTVALIKALSEQTGRSMSKAEVAELACHLEIERLQMPIGKQDQYASARGGLNNIIFAADGVHITPLDLPAEILSSLSTRLLLFATGQTRNSADILGQQRADTEKQTKTIDALHRIKSLAIAIQSTLQAGDLDRFGQLLDQSWQEKKSLSNQISSQSIDLWYTAARQAGAIGGKITGAGGGGFLLLYCPPEHQVAVRTELAQYGLREMTFAFDFIGPQVLTTHSSAEQPLFTSQRYD